MGLKPQATLLTYGDSLTQTWDAGSLNQRLAYAYARKMDVVSRGYGGYNTEWAIPILSEILEPDTTPNTTPIKLMTLWFGANDACIPPSPQHLPLSTFTHNLHTLLSLSASTPSTPLPTILITPPPISVPLRASLISPKPIDRTWTTTKSYRDAVIAVGLERSIPVVDIWGAIVDLFGGEDKAEELLGEDGRGGLGSVLRDGLHLNADGYQILFDLLLETIAKHYPHLLPESLSPVWPLWTDIDRSNVQSSLLEHHSKHRSSSSSFALDSALDSKTARDEL